MHMIMEICFHVAALAEIQGLVIGVKRQVVWNVFGLMQTWQVEWLWSQHF